MKLWGLVQSLVGLIFASRSRKCNVLRDSTS